MNMPNGLRKKSIHGLLHQPANCAGALILGLVLSTSVLALDAGDVAPDWSLRDSDGAETAFYAGSDGAVSVILFWATWCPLCGTLMPHLQKVADEYAGRPVRFYALNVWENADPESYLKRNHFTFKLLLAAEAVAGDYGVPGTPGLFVVAQDHRVLYKRQSGEDDFDVETAVREAIDSALVPN